MLFLGHARGSASEVETQLVIAKALGLGSDKLLHTTEELCSEVGRMLNAMMKALRKPAGSPVPSPWSLSRCSLIPSP